jgi:NADH-quinone oxidoreductase subunit B
MQGILLLREAVGKERRPLSWVVGPQETVRPVMPSQRELKRAERMQTTVLREPDHI